MTRRRFTAPPPGTITLYVDKSGSVRSRLPDPSVPLVHDAMAAAEALYEGHSVRVANDRLFVESVRSKLGNFV